MKHSIRRTTHRDIQRHRIHKGLAGSDIARQYAFVAILVVCQSVLHHLTGSLLKELHAIGMSSKDSTVARQRESNGLCQRVH